MFGVFAVVMGSYTIWSAVLKIRKWLQAIMNIFNKAKKVFFIATLCSCFLYRESKAQWSIDGGASYRTEAEHFIVLDQALKILEKASPKADLDLSLQNKDYSFASYNGYGLEVPGLKNKFVGSLLTHGIHFKVLKGSSDFLPAELGQRQQVVAEKYMKPYNLALSDFLYRNNPNFKKLVDDSKKKLKSPKRR